MTGIKVEAAVSSGECTLGMAGVPQGSVHGRLLFPEICLMELQLLASGSPDMEVLGHVLQSLLGAVKGHHNNAALLYQQVRLFSHTKLMYVCEYMLMLHSHLFQETFVQVTYLQLVESCVPVTSWNQSIHVAGARCKPLRIRDVFVILSLKEESGF